MLTPERWGFFHGSRALAGAVFALAFILAASIPGPAAAAARYAAIVVDAETGDVLYAHNASKLRHPASLTKMMTLYLLFDALDAGTLTLDKKLKVSRRAARQPRSRLGLRAGRTISVKNAIGALVTKSANDVAMVVAEAIAGSPAKFARLMTLKARELGMRHTTFRNPSGLYNRSQRSTARDMAILAVALMRDHARYYGYFSTRAFRYAGRTYKNHNKLLYKYAGVDGVKTGYIRASGFNIAASAVRGGRRLVGVVLGGRSGYRRDRQMMRLFDRAFAGKIRPTGTRIAAVIAPRSVTTSNAKTAPPGERSAPKRNPLSGASQQALAGEPAWGIQVGAFRQERDAAAAAASARKSAPRLLQDARIAIVAIESEIGAFYRARFAGMTADNAIRTCARLRRRSVPCIAMETQSACDYGHIAQGSSDC